MIHMRHVFSIVSFLIILSSYFEVCALKLSKIEADRVVVYKMRRVMELWSGDHLLKRYTIALGGSPTGPKTQEGDQKTPEGSYKLDWRNPNSAFHKSIHISYPNMKDRVQAQKRGVRAGGEIFLHGIGKKWGFLGSSHALHDWTKGCIAVTNAEMDEIWEIVPNGTPIMINP